MHLIGCTSEVAPHRLHLIGCTSWVPAPPLRVLGVNCLQRATDPGPGEGEGSGPGLANITRPNPVNARQSFTSAFRTSDFCRLLLSGVKKSADPRRRRGGQNPTQPRQPSELQTTASPLPRGKSADPRRRRVGPNPIQNRQPSELHTWQPSELQTSVACL